MTTCDTPLETVLRRDRRVVATALVTLAALAWCYLLWLAHTMPMTDAGMAAGTGAMSMPASMPATAPHAWHTAEFGFVFAMWAVMMVGMMLPSAAPAILIHARVGRQAATRGRPFAATGFFAAGYLLAWICFALLATFGQWLLAHLLVLDATMASSSRVFSGALLVVAGVFQWTPLKAACLTQCHSPLHFIHRHGGFRATPAGSLALGVRHGIYCIGCCWALMALLFVGGVMNILWIAVLSGFVLAEKVFGQAWLSRAAGAVLVVAGAWMLAIPAM